MTLFPKTILLIAALGLAACEKGGFGGLNGSDGISSSNLDPATPAYFNEAIGDRVLFAVDESTLSNDARRTLEAQAEWLIANGSYTATIEGHADEQGTREYNLALGARRAAAARDYLVANGVADGRLRVKSYGKERPIEICSTEVCYSKNRRAVTIVSSGIGS